jgi:tetratricopeptide (TPR) repeat protein
MGPSGGRLDSGFRALDFRSDRRSAGAGMTSQPSSSVNPASPRTPNPEARDLYLKGRYYWNKRTPEDLNKAVDYFTQAIVHDPGYADAFVGLADSYNLLREYSLMPPSEAFPRALAAARKAVELDDKSSDAHASVAFVSFYGMWDVKTAEVEFRRALEVKSQQRGRSPLVCDVPGLAPPPARISRRNRTRTRAWIHLPGRSWLIREAFSSSPAKTTRPSRCSNRWKPPSPISFLPTAISAIPTWDKQDYPNYLLEFKKEASLLHDETSLSLVQAADIGFAMAAEQAMLESLRQQQKKLYAQGRFSPFLLAETCALLGDKKEALQYLQAAYDQHADGVAQIEGDPFFNNLHDEPAYRELATRIGLPLPPP